MADDYTPTVSEDTPDPIQALRDEMAEQFATLKQSFETTIQERDDTITKLKEENDSLHRALIRSAMTEPPKTQAPKTPEQEYDETIKALADKTLRYMSVR